MRSRAVLGAVTGVVLLGLLAASALVSANREATSYPPGSPEATVQLFYQSLIDGRPDDAGALLTEESAACDIAPYFDADSIVRVLLDAVDIDDAAGEASVEVRVTRTRGGGLFDDNEAVSTDVMSLIREGDVWRISRPSRNYYDCPTP